MNKRTGAFSRRPQGLTEDEIILPSRTLRFPTDYSIGWLYLRRWNSPIVTWDDLCVYESWLELGEARREFHIPSGGEVQLCLWGEEFDDFSPNDIQDVFAYRFHDESMACLQNLTGLLKLDLGRYDIRDGKVVSVDDAYITDKGLKSLRYMVGLRRLALEGQLITGKGLCYLREMNKLKELTLEGTLVGDEGLENLICLSNLEYLYLGNTNVTDAGCAYLENALPDCEIETEPYWTYEKDDEG